MGQPTFLEWFEGHFGEELDARTVRAFLEMSPEYAATLNESYSDVIKQYKNFKLPQRNSNHSRPLLWGEIHDGLKTTYPPEISQTKEQSLIYDSIVVVGNFKLALEGMAQGDMEIAYRWYGGFVRWLHFNRPLILDGVVNITSERNAYQVAPVNRHNTDTETLFFDLIKHVEEKNRSMTDPVARILKYMSLCDDQETDILIDKINKKAVSTIFEYWSINNSDRNLSIEDETWRFYYDFDHIRPEDLVSVRKNDDVLADLRGCFRKAMQLADQRERKECLDDCFDRLNRQNGTREGAASTLGMSVTAFALDTFLNGLGTISTTIGSLILGDKEERKSKAKSAARSIIHFLEPAEHNQPGHYVAELKQWMNEVRG